MTCRPFEINRKAFLLAGMALTFSLPYRISILFPQTWHGYVALTLFLAALTLFYLFAPPPKSSPHALDKRIAYPLSLILIGLAGILRLHWMRAYPIDAQYGDMLPLIDQAGRHFLSGHFPYTEYHVPWPLPLTFFPMLWISYLPTLLLNLDLRWTGLVCTLLLIPLLLHRRPAALLPVLLFAILPVFTFFTVNGHTQPYWLYLCAFGYALTRRNPLASAVFLGLTLASRQTALILVPFAALAWYRSHGLRPAGIALCISGTVTAALCLPFFLINPHAFLLEPLHHYRELAEAYRQGTGDPARLLETLGFANLFSVLSLTHLLGPARILILLLGIGGCARVARTPADHIAWMAATGMLFTFFTPIPWLYAYYPWWLLGILALPVTSEPDPLP